MMSELSSGALLNGCETYMGKSASEKNSKAVMQVYDAIKTSYGPLGLDKMCIDATGAVTITNDGATILKNMLLEEPAATMLVNLALEQDKEVGDGTTSVVLLAANLISKGNQLIQEGVHPSVVVSGYRMAFGESIKFIKNRIAKKIAVDEKLFKEKSILDSIIETAISSKIISQEKDLFIRIVKDSLYSVKEEPLQLDNTKTEKENSFCRFPVERINVLKSVGGSMNESQFFDGYILNCSVASKMMPTRIDKVKAVCIGFSLFREKLPLTAAVQLSDPSKLEAIRTEETELTLRKCKAIVDAGVNLVLTTGGIDEICIKMLCDAGIVAVRRCPRGELETIAKAMGTDLKDSIVDMDNEYRVENLGECNSYELKQVGDYDLVFLSGLKSHLGTILLKGPSTQILDEAERSVNDALQVSRRTLESKSVVPGGGSVEAALMFLLEEFSFNINCKEHVAIHRFADSLLELPRILCSNAGLDANQMVAELLSKQHDMFKGKDTETFLGMDVYKGVIQDNFANGILEPAGYKMKALKAATEAAIGVLRINEIVKFP